MTTTSEKILKDIKEKHISPAPRWRFVLKNWIIWLIFSLALLVAALSFAAMLEILINHDWDIYFRLHKTFWEFLLMSLPYIWIVSMIIFSLIAYYDFVHTRGWYRHRAYRVVSASILVSMVLGGILFYSGFGKRVDQAFDVSVPFYGSININKKQMWCHPEEGLLGGEIVKMHMDDPERFIIKDCHGREWDIRKPVPQVKSLVIQTGERIKIIGRQIEEGFEAEELRRW